MAENETLKKGRAMRRTLMCERFAEGMESTVYDSPIMQKFADYSSEAVLGLLWSRPGLDLKTRTLICVISDTAKARWPELRIHLRMARGQGWTEDELAEALLHMAGYVGLPAAREAMIIADEVFAELRAGG